jgi:hypothetical protein
MNTVTKNKIKEGILFPIRILGKIFSSIGKFLSRDINEERLNEIKSEHLYLASKSHLPTFKGF